MPVVLATATAALGVNDVLVYCGIIVAGLSSALAWVTKRWIADKDRAEARSEKVIEALTIASERQREAQAAQTELVGVTAQLVSLANEFLAEKRGKS